MKKQTIQMGLLVIVVAAALMFGILSALEIMDERMSQRKLDAQVTYSKYPLPVWVVVESVAKTYECGNYAMLVRDTRANRRYIIHAWPSGRHCTYSFTTTEISYDVNRTEFARSLEIPTR